MSKTLPTDHDCYAYVFYSFDGIGVWFCGYCDETLQVGGHFDHHAGCVEGEPQRWDIRDRVIETCSDCGEALAVHTV